MAMTRWGGLRLEPYNPNAVDADGDGIVQEGTSWERPGGTRLIDELGREIRNGITSAQRPPKMRVQRDGKDIDYTPTYGKDAPAPEAPPGKPTALANVGAPSLKERGMPTLKSMLGTIGEPLQRKPAPQQTQTMEAERRLPEQPTIEIDFDDFDEIQSISDEISDIQQESLAGIVGTTWSDWVEQVTQFDRDGNEIQKYRRAYPLPNVGSDEWFERVEAEIRGNKKLDDKQRDQALQNLSDLQRTEELASARPWMTEASTTSDPFADPKSTAPYTIEEARTRFTEALQRLSRPQQDRAMKAAATNREKRNVQDAEKQALQSIEAERAEETRRMILPAPVNTREHQPVPGQALAGQRSKTAAELKGESTETRDVGQIQSQADQVLVKAGNLSDPIHEQELVDMLLDDGVVGKQDEYSTYPNSSGVSLIERLIRLRGFDGDVLTVSDDELDEMIYAGYKEVSRGGSKDPNGKFLDGEMFIGNGIDGAGLYFASVTFRPDSQLEVIPHFRAEEYARSAPDGGSVLRGAINPSSKRINISRLRKELDAYRASKNGTGPEIQDSALYALRSRLAKRAETDKQAEKALESLDTLILSPYGEPNHAIGVGALLMGYDAVIDDPTSNRTLLYNRSAVVMSSEVKSPDEYSQMMGYENFRARQNAKLIAQGKLPLDPTPEQYEQWKERRIAEIASAGVVSAAALQQASVTSTPVQNMNPDEL